jgi:hypothetical protein
VTPTARELAYCRKQGWTACVVEKWIPQTRQRKDALGFGDLLVLDGAQGPVLVQVTSSGNVASRVTKIRETCREAAEAWLDAGGRIVVAGWAKQGKRGARKLWTRRAVDVWF